MKSLICLLSLLLSQSLYASSALKPVSVIWEQDPIPVELLVSSEQRVNFPESIAHLDVPEELSQSADLLMSAKGVLLITIRTPIQSTRVFATSVTGSVYLLDISATESATPKVITIIDPAIEAAILAAKREGEVPPFLSESRTLPTPHRPSYVVLSRFALSHHIGPERLIPEPPAGDVTSVSVKPIKLDRFVRFNRDIAAQPLKQWKIGAYYVTTIRVVNQGPDRYQFDPRGLRGEFVFVATLSTVLEPAGLASETVWSVISKKPFSLAVGG